MNERVFPVLGGGGWSVPWSLLEPHESQALKNHGQTLGRLAERGGLSVEEMVAVLDHRPLRDIWSMRPDTSLARLRELLAAHAEPTTGKEGDRR